MEHAAQEPQAECNLPKVDPASLEYLAVDGFLENFADAAALRTAFELQLVDRLLVAGLASHDELMALTGADAPGLHFLLGLLAANGVVETIDITGVRLTPAFTRALRFRDLMETRLEAALFMAGDFGSHLSAMIANPGQFMRTARLFRLFDYGRCFDATPDNLRHTWRWMRLTTQLTRHEAQVCLDLVDLSAHRRLLDVGGNSGEFAVQACRRHPALVATVVDLPVVCELGLEWVLAAAERERIVFLPTDVRRQPLPTGHDLISFKSMLHDWPESEALEFIDKAAQVLEPGGRLLIFERAPLSGADRARRFATLPVVMFFRSYREPTAYIRQMQALGFQDLQCLQVQLDTPFFVLTGRKAAA